MERLKWKQVVKTLATISFLFAIAIVAVGPAQGQSLAHAVRVHITFDFFVDNTKLPAGDYYVGRLRQSSSDSVLMISSAVGRTLMVRLTSAVQKLGLTERGAVVFHRYGDQYFLSQVWAAGSTTGRALAKSHNEREVKQKPREEVSVVARP